jgi:hypothetical protein
MARKLYRRKGTDLITAIIHNEYVISMGRDDIPNRRLYKRLTKEEEFFEGMYSFYLMSAIADKSYPWRTQRPFDSYDVAKVHLAVHIGEKFPTEYMRWTLTETSIPHLTEVIEHVKSENEKKFGKTHEHS